MDSFFYLVMFAGGIAGASTALLGVYIVGMRMPFIGICISHAAMAGTVLALLLNFPPAVGALAASVITSISMAAVRPDKSRIDTNVGLAILFSLMLGLTFLGIGFVRGSRSEILGLLWGSILFVKLETAIIIAILTVTLAIFTLIFNKELKILLFSRSIASATGVHETFLYCLFLALCGIILSVNLKIIGGLMIFSLITNPAAAAYQICKGQKAVIFTATSLGMFTAVAGFLVSFYFDLPTGASIVILSTIIFALSILWKRYFLKSNL